MKLRGHLLLAVVFMVATVGKAQTALTVDTTFRFYYSPEYVEYWAGVNNAWAPSVWDIMLRHNGELLLSSGGFTDGVQFPASATGFAALINAEDGSLVERILINSTLTEIPSTNQYFANYKRFNYDGGVDYSFGWPDLAQVENTHPCWHVFEDRSVMVGGSYQIRSGEPADKVLIKVDEWGQWDSTFTPRRAHVGAQGFMLYPLRNGQFLFSGDWYEYEGRPSGAVIRINADGSQDTTFTFRGWKASLESIIEQEDGKIIMGGKFWMNDYQDTLKLVRVLPDGSLDPTFNNFVDYRSGIHQFSGMAGPQCLGYLSVDVLLVGGFFTHVDGQPRSCIASVDTLGNLLDHWAGGGLRPTHNEATGTQHMSLNGFKCLDNGSCYIYGQYKGFVDANGYHPEQVMISKLYMPDVGMADLSASKPMLRVWPNPGNDFLHLDWPDMRLEHVELYDAQGRAVIRSSLHDGTATVDVLSLASGVYSVFVRASGREVAAVCWVKL